MLCRGSNIIVTGIQESATTILSELTILRQLIIAASIVFIGEWTTLLRVFIILLVLDYLSGLFKAVKTCNVNSYLGMLGIVKKLGYLIVISAFYQLGIMLGEPEVIKNAVLVIFIVNEFVSILENLSELEGDDANYLPKGVIELAEEIVADKYNLEQRFSDMKDK